MLSPEDLVHFELVKRLKYKYLRGIDLKLWDEVESCFTEDATASYGGGAYTFEGRDAIMSFLSSSMASTDFLSSHKCHHPELEYTDTGEITGVWGLEDTVIHLEFGVVIRGAAFYTDRYVELEHQDWRIAHTGYKRVYEELQPRAADAQITAHWWNTDGRSELPAG
jgi:hypothetical protein